MFFVLLALVALGVLAVGLLAVVFERGMRSRTREIAATEAADSVAHLLAVCELFGPDPRTQPEYSALRKSIARRLRGIRGFTESGGLHGDGTDWYEVDLSPDLAAELGAKLSQSPLLKQARSIPFREKYTPDWWPSTWPTGSICYEYRFIFLVLPPGGTRLWVQVIRT